MQNTLNLSVAGMHCGSCVRRVSTALEAIPGVQVQSVEVGSAHVAFDSDKATPQEIAASINRIGFQASIQ